MTMDSSIAFTSDISEYHHFFQMRHGSTSAFDLDRGSNQPERPHSGYYSRGYPKATSGEFSSPPTESLVLASRIDFGSCFDAETNASTVNEPSERDSWSFLKSVPSFGAYHSFLIRISDELSSTLTEPFYFFGSIGPRNLFNAELADRVKQAWETVLAYQSRIEVLRSDAELDGFSVNEASERNFWSFVKSVPFACKAELVLVDNGNLRAVWDWEDGSHLGLQFLGDHTLQYVIFRRRKGSRHLSRVAGRDTSEGVKRQVRTFELEALLQA